MDPLAAKVDTRKPIKWAKKGVMVDIEDFEETDVANRFLAVNIAGTEVDVREAATDDLLFFAIVHLVVIVLGHP